MANPIAEYDLTAKLATSRLRVKTQEGTRPYGFTDMPFSSLNPKIEQDDVYRHQCDEIQHINTH